MNTQVATPIQFSVTPPKATETVVTKVEPVATEKVEVVEEPVRPKPEIFSLKSLKNASI